MIKPADGVRVIKSPEFKIKDQFQKNIQVVHLRDFGFTPETLIIERVRGNWFTISAVLTPERIKELDKKDRDQEKAIAEVKKAMKSIKKKNDTNTDTA